MLSWGLGFSKPLMSQPYNAGIISGHFVHITFTGYIFPIDAISQIVLMPEQETFPGALIQFVERWEVWEVAAGSDNRIACDQPTDGKMNILNTNPSLKKRDFICQACGLKDGQQVHRFEAADKTNVDSLTVQNLYFLIHPLYRMQTEIDFYLTSWANREPTFLPYATPVSKLIR